MFIILIDYYCKKLTSHSFFLITSHSAKKCTDDEKNVRSKILCQNVIKSSQLAIILLSVARKFTPFLLLPQPNFFHFYSSKVKISQLHPQWRWHGNTAYPQYAVFFCWARTGALSNRSVSGLGRDGRTLTIAPKVLTRRLLRLWARYRTQYQFLNCLQ